jgi:catechol-2,3-dioxygenase
MMSPVTRLSHVALRSPDVEALRTYYTEIIGLSPYDAGDGAVHLASGGHGPALTLLRGDEPRLDHLGFELAPAGEEELLAHLASEGVSVETSTDAEPGFTRVHAIADVEGNRLDLCIVDEDREPATRAASGIVPQKLGHVATRTVSAEAVTGFYESALGFRWSDWIGDFFVFLRCNIDHHTVNFLNASKPGQLHHFAFELQDASHVAEACDTLSRNGVPLIWGPGRHGVGHNLFTYHKDPDDNVVELFCDLDRMVSEELGYYEPRPWHGDLPQRPKRWTPDPTSANLWGPGPPEGFMA